MPVGDPLESGGYHVMEASGFHVFALEHAEFRRARRQVQVVVVVTTSCSDTSAANPQQQLCCIREHEEPSHDPPLPSWRCTEGSGACAYLTPEGQPQPSFCLASPRMTRNRDSSGHIFCRSWSSYVVFLEGAGRQREILRSWTLKCRHLDHKDDPSNAHECIASKTQHCLSYAPTTAVTICTEI